jgi:hypothetical protein
MTAAFIFKIILQALLAFLIGTLVADICHYLFHKCLRSKNNVLKAIGHFHLVHHRFFSHTLQIEKECISKNIYHHVISEYVAQIAGIFVCIFFLPLWPIMIAALLQTIILLNVLKCKGIDMHHRSLAKLPPTRSEFFVNANYHALHHLYANQYFSSYIKILDWILGTSHHLEKKRIAMTGASGALGREMKKLLEKEGAIVTAFKYNVDYTYENYDKLKETLENTDILFLCHGTKYENTQQANCDSFIKMIELFKSVRKPELLPLEIWAVGSEIECHPCFWIKNLYPYANSKRNFARSARKYFHDRDIQYRHLVHSAFTSPMGPGLMTAKFAAKMTLFFIKRDFKYIPVTYTGFAWINYLRFVFTF